jgi:PAS domain S-box-containing protein
MAAEDDSQSGLDFNGVATRSTVARYFIAVAATIFALYLRGVLTPFLGSTNPYHTLWAAVVFSAWYCGLGPSILSTLLGLAGVAYWIVPSFHSHAVAPAFDLNGMIGFALFSGLIIAMAESSRRASAKRIAAELASQRAKALFEAFMDNSPAATYLKDEQGKYVYANRMIRERFHLPSIIGKTDFDIFPRDMASEFREHDAQVFREDKAFEFVEHSVEADGEHTWLSIKFPLQDTDGKKLLGGKSFDITDRQRAEEALREARQELAQRVKERTIELSRANQGLRELSARLLQLQDEERRRIARELHDSVGQMLAAISMNIALVKSESDRLSPVVSRAVLDNEHMIQQITREIRTISHLLHPPLLDEAGLRSALSWFVEQFGERSKIAVRLEIAPSLDRLDPEAETAIFRVVQECLTNIHKHSGSSTALIRLNQTEDSLRLEVWDFGHGISPEKHFALTSTAKTGVGLRGMRERVGQLGGALEVQSDKTGTMVSVVLPLTPPADAPDTGERVA